MPTQEGTITEVGVYVCPGCGEHFNEWEYGDPANAAARCCPAEIYDFHYRCDECGIIHETPDQASKCCPVWCCDTCLDGYDSEAEAIACEYEHEAADLADIADPEPYQPADEPTPVVVNEARRRELLSQFGT